VLSSYLSYDEMPLASILGVATPTFYINDGSKTNKGRKTDPVVCSHEEEGVCVGLVGARFERHGLMEWRHMICSAEQNTAANGYGPAGDALLQVWAASYGLPAGHFPTFECVEAAVIAGDVYENGGRYLRVRQAPDIYLDTVVYRARCRRSLEPFLREADHRARLDGTAAYIQASPLGLGAWSLEPMGGAVAEAQCWIQFSAYLEVPAPPP
jgi:hypothetical protein